MNTYNHKSNYTGDILTNITFRYIQLYLQLYLGMLTNI